MCDFDGFEGFPNRLSFPHERCLNVLCKDKRPAVNNCQAVICLQCKWLSANIIVWIFQIFPSLFFNISPQGFFH